VIAVTVMPGMRQVVPAGGRYAAMLVVLVLVVLVLVVLVRVVLVAAVVVMVVVAVVAAAVVVVLPILYPIASQQCMVVTCRVQVSVTCERSRTSHLFDVFMTSEEPEQHEVCPPQIQNTLCRPR
jgi:hypothetical protein